VQRRPTVQSPGGDAGASAATCGDGRCDANEACGCARDCGACPGADGGLGGGGTGDGAAADGGAADADVPDAPNGQSYTTKFPLTENPIVEGGHWINGGALGVDWHDVSTTPGLAIGHQSGSSYTDGTALLTGTWGPTQTAEAVVHTVNQKDSCYQEVELRLRSALSAKSCTGYEISFKASKTASAYLIIVRWNGKLGDFTYLKRYDGAQYGVKDGDVVKATIVGNVITAYLNGVQVGTATDSTYTTGSPGMGFNLETGDASCVGTNGDYGFTQYSAQGS